MEKQLLFRIINELSHEDLETFKWFTNDQSFLQHLPAIPRARLQEATLRIHVVDLMIQTYSTQVRQVTARILEKIPRSDLLELLQTPQGSAAPTLTQHGRQATDTDRDRPAEVLEVLKAQRSASQTNKPGLRKNLYELILDINSAHGYLKLSHNNRKVECVGEEVRPYDGHPDRFDTCCQVLCSPALIGRCYWEVAWSGQVLIAVAYGSVDRKGGDGGGDLVFGQNAKSWSLWCSSHGLSVRHNAVKSVLPLSSPSSPSSGRVAVDLDYSAGSLSFYRVSTSGDLTLLHTYSATFTQPLYAGFWLGPNSSVSLCEV